MATSLSPWKSHGNPHGKSHGKSRAPTAFGDDRIAGLEPGPSHHPNRAFLKVFPMVEVEKGDDWWDSWWDSYGFIWVNMG